MTKTNPYAAGARGLCPHCGEGYLFDGFLKVAPTCEACGFELGKYETGDGAATFVILIAGTVCAFGALFMVHLSRLCEELILWMNPRLDFISLPDRFCTGSSIMPQKRNPDVPELARGKCARVVGHLMGLLTLMKSQPLAYNKDNQEDKEPLFDDPVQ